MKFRHRQILLSILFIFGVIIFLRSWTSDNPDLNPADRNSLPRLPIAIDSNVEQQYSLSKQNTFLPEIQGQVDDLSIFLAYVPRSPGSLCRDILRPVNVSENQSFQRVDNLTYNYVFSAFLDLQEKLVRVVGLHHGYSKSVFCLLWYEGGSRELKVVHGTVKVLPEGHGLMYSAAYIHCPLPDDEHPYALSVTHSDCRSNQSVVQPTNVLSVQKASEKLQYNFAVCVTPLNFQYSRAYELVEMLELNRILGAEQFTFYLNSVGENVAEVLRWYEEQGLVQLIRWDLPCQVDHWPPMKSQPPEVHYFGQLASHNDCLNRHRGRSRYLVYSDLDEFIIPKNFITWKEMLDSLGKGSSAFSFRCLFFRKDWPPNEEDFPGKFLARRFRSVVLLTDKREAQPFPIRHRSKYIINPNDVQTVGIHDVWHFRGAQHMVHVNPADGLLYHYRDWEIPKDQHRAVRDTDMYRFKKDLLKRLRDRWAELPDVPLNLPVSKYGQL